MIAKHNLTTKRDSIWRQVCQLQCEAQQIIERCAPSQYQLYPYAMQLPFKMHYSSRFLCTKISRFGFSGIDYAYNKTAWQSTDYDQTTTAFKAIDAPYDFKENLAQTLEEPWSYWAVDIARAKYIEMIYVLTGHLGMHQQKVICSHNDYH